LIGQTQAFAKSLRELALQASALRLVADALASSESGHEEARQLVGQARAVAEKIDNAPDRMVAISYLAVLREIL
jgi:hypothetical protein